MIKAEQIKAARALLRMEQDDLARRSGVSVSTIRRLEATAYESAVAGDTAAQVQHALEEAGVEFVHEGVIRKANARDEATLFAELWAIAERSARQADAHRITDKDLYGDDGLPA